MKDVGSVLEVERQTSAVTGITFMGKRRIKPIQVQHYTEADWKLFRRKIAGWQTAYIDRLNKGYMELLGQDASPADKFWELEERIRADKKKAGVLADMRRSQMISNLVSLVVDGAIGLEDLEEFSDPLKEIVKYLAGL